VDGVTADTEKPETVPVSLVDSSFDVALWGYSRTQVRNCLTELEQQLAELIGERDRATELAGRLARAEEEIATLRARLAGVPPVVHQVGSQVKGIMAMAEREAAELREAAYEELAKARAERDRARTEVAELRRRSAAEAVAARRDCEQMLEAYRRQQHDAAAAVLADAYRRAREMVTRR
jgi:DNA repair exonuclease SbcCD ATPase subunit